MNTPNTSTKNMSGFHPDNTRLDRLRAGLLDDDPAGKTRLLEHLAACGDCRRRFEAWDGLARALNDASFDTPALSHSLGARRRAALAGYAATRPVRMVPRYALAAALAALLIGAGVFLVFEQPAEQIPPTLTQADVPDLYVDLDFYLWLTQENANGEGAPNRG